MERKEFIKTVCLACGAAMAMKYLAGCEKYNPAPAYSFTIDLTAPAYSALNSTGGYAYKNGVIVICTAPNVFHALSQVCTHAGCTVQYDYAGKKVFCPCHYGLYDISGNVISGPPPRPLKLYSVVQNGTFLTIRPI